MEQMYFNDDTMYFVIGDLHGQGKIYDLIVAHFDELAIQTNKKIVLIINGDIIDRGPDSIRMLVDVMQRVQHKKGNIEVVMSPGNHEEMMYAALEYFRTHGKFDQGPGYTVNNLWFHPANHGTATYNEFIKLSSETQMELLEFLKSLPLYCTIKSSIPGRNSYAIVHASPPSNAMSARRVPTLGEVVTNPIYQPLRECLIYRAEEHTNAPNISLPDSGVITIIGHTPVDNPNGFALLENNKLLMIDGGCAWIANNPNSNNLVHQMMATLVELSDIPGKTKVGLYGDVYSKDLRQGMTR